MASPRTNLASLLPPSFGANGPGNGLLPFTGTGLPGLGGTDLPGGGLATGAGSLPGGLGTGNGFPGGAAGLTPAEQAAAAEQAALNGERAAGGMPYMPYMPPMGGMGGQGGNNARERRTWLEEDAEVWGDDTDSLPPPVIGTMP